MRRFVPTLILVVICIGAFWYASSQSFFKKEVPNTSLITAGQEDIVGFRVKTDTEAYSLEKQGEVWQMVKPGAMPMNNYGVVQWLNAFFAVKREGEVETTPADYKGYGLAEPLQEYEVKLKNGTVQTLQVGEKLPIEGFLYAKWKEDAAVFKVSDSLIKPLAKKQLEYMDPLIVQLKPADTQKIELEWQGKKWTLLNVTAAGATAADGQKWTLDGKTLKSEDASAIIMKLQYMNATDVVKPISEVKMDAPEFKLVLQEKSATQTYTGKVIGDNVWIAKQGGTWAYPLLVTSIDEIKVLLDPAAAAEATPTATPTATK